MVSKILAAKTLLVATIFTTSSSEYAVVETRKVAWKILIGRVERTYRCLKYRGDMTLEETYALSIST